MATKDYNLPLTGISPVFDRGTLKKELSENKNYDSKIERNNNFGWNKSEKLFENLNIWNSEDGVNQKKWKKNIFKESNILSKSSSTLSLHISAYENEASTATNESDSDTTLKAAKLDTKKSGKTWKNVKQLFAQLPLTPISIYEFPRQQESVPKTPEVMQFKTSQRLFNFNNDGGSPKVKTAEKG
uniref:Uncharacterized protein n=1 Tax=Panagrolaimus davidi TaxID=227884 RepID=A0A914QST2_9BILA